MSSHDHDPAILLHDVARLMRIRFDRWARHYGFTRAQGIMLLRLARQPGISQNEMAALLEVEPITVGRQIDRMETRGLIERRPHPSDRRIRKLYLLPPAEPLVALVEKYKSETEEIFLGELDPAAVKTMLEVLLTMRNKLLSESFEQMTAVGR